MEVIFADTREELTEKIIGYYHDHCYHYYNGLTIDVPDELKIYIKQNKKYCFIFKEDEPHG